MTHYSTCSRGHRVMHTMPAFEPRYLWAYQQVWSRPILAQTADSCQHRLHSASSAELRKSLVQQCNRLLPGSVTNISVADITSRISQGIAVFDVKPSMNLDLVPKFLILHDSKDSWLSGYRVPVPNQRGQVRLGAPYVYVAQPHYDRSNKDLTVAVRVEVLSSADDAPTHDLPAWLGKCHTAFCEKLFDEVFNARTGKLNFSQNAVWHFPSQAGRSCVGASSADDNTPPSQQQ